MYDIIIFHSLGDFENYYCANNNYYILYCLESGLLDLPTETILIVLSIIIASVLIVGYAINNRDRVQGFYMFLETQMPKAVTSRAK